MDGDSSAARPARRPRANRAAPPRAARLPGAASRPATGGKLIEFVAPPRKEKVAITGGSGRIG
ncbi:MAG: hypothetical protein JNK60_22275, partial [Acidobacteria bacterium]|nr:hypothetical protein [Acidobacteriota bacterium]